MAIDRSRSPLATSHPRPVQVPGHDSDSDAESHGMPHAREHDDGGSDSESGTPEGRGGEEVVELLRSAWDEVPKEGFQDLERGARR